MGLKLILTGTASLVHVHNPCPQPLDIASEYRDEYYARIKADDGSILGREHPLKYDIPLSKEEYESLMKQVTANEESCDSHEFEYSKIEVLFNVKLTPNVKQQNK